MNAIDTALVRQSQSVPNIRDETWIVRKFAQTFPEENNVIADELAKKKAAKKADKLAKKAEQLCLGGSGVD